ncbi:MAG: dihydrodipicolinate synthase family protein, partial [Streptosporangiaceae bacterium]
HRERGHFLPRQDAGVAAAGLGRGPGVSPLTHQNLRGTWAPVLLPLAPDEAIDFGLLHEELTVLLGAGLDGIYTNGTASEFHCLEEDEYDRITDVVAQACQKAGVPCQLGASQMSGQASLRRIRVAAAYDPAAIQVILPDWCPLSADEVLSTIDRMARQSGEVPLVLYNPPHAKTRLTPTLFGCLAAEFPQLIGVKVAGGDAAWFEQMRDLAADLAIFVAGHRLASGLRQGASGSYSNVACMTPRGAVSWYQAMRTDPVAAQESEIRLNAFLATHVFPLQAAHYGNAALDKALAAAGGWAPIGTRLRWPSRSVPGPAVDALRQAARDELPEFFPAAP